MNKKITLQTILLLCIVSFGFLLRLYGIDSIPSGFFADEASIGYNAYAILNKGEDEYGKKFPLFFRAFGEYKSPIQIYSTVPFIALFGLNEFSVRLPSAIFGTGTIIAIYFLTKELLKHHKSHKVIALFAAFFLAISPWHIHFSRIAFELMPFGLLTTLGLFIFLKTLSNRKFLPLSIILFSLALYSYFPARLFVPLFGLTIFFLYIQFFLKRKRLTLIIIFLLVLFLTPIIQHALSSEGLTRWNQISIFTNPSNDTTLIRHIAYNYLSHFSLDFLFFKGDIDMPGQFTTRHSVRGMGELYLFQLPLIILGLVYLLKNRRGNMLITLIFTIWLLLYPIGSMFTIDKSAQATRSIIGVIPLQILSAIGLYYGMNLFRCFKTLKKIHFYYFFFMGIFISIIVVLSFLNFIDLYFQKYPLYSSDFWGWQYGPRKIMQYFLSVKNNYDDLYMSGEFNGSEIFIRFYDPKNSCQSKCKLGDFSQKSLFRRQLFSLSPELLEKLKSEKLFSIKKTIYYPNGNIAFLIGE